MSDDAYPKRNYKSDDYQSSNRTSNRNNNSNNGITSQSHSGSTDNRSKFENNISASFANRQKRDDDHYPRNYNDSRPKWGGKSSMGNQRQNSQDASSGSYSKAPNSRSQAPNYPQNSYQNSTTNPSRGQKYAKNFAETVSCCWLIIVSKIIRNNFIFYRVSHHVSTTNTLEMITVIVVTLHLII